MQIFMMFLFPELREHTREYWVHFHRSRRTHLYIEYVLRRCWKDTANYRSTFNNDKIKSNGEVGLDVSENGQNEKLSQSSRTGQHSIYCWRLHFPLTITFLDIPFRRLFVSLFFIALN